MSSSGHRSPVSPRATGGPARWHSSRSCSARLFELESRYIVESATKADLAHLGFNLLGLLAAVAAIGLMYAVAVLAAKAIGHTEVKLAGAFIGSLIPIALAYSVAH